MGSEMCIRDRCTNGVQPDSIAQAVSHEMSRRGVTISALANKIGVERTTLGRWLAGERGLRARDAAAALDVLGLQIVAAPHHLGPRPDISGQIRTRI